MPLMPAIRYYECHITMMGDPDFIEKSVKGMGGTFSKIDGDPIFGKGVKCYLTHHYQATLEYDEVIRRMNNDAESLISKGVNVIRTKVEGILYDKRWITNG